MTSDLAVALSAAQIRATEDREAELRAARVPVPSTSSVPTRCATCGEWNARTRTACRVCGLGMAG